MLELVMDREAHKSNYINLSTNEILFQIIQLIYNKRIFRFYFILA